MSREVLQQALDALKSLDDTLLFTEWENGEGEDIGPQLRESVNAIRAELAKPEPEPVAWMYLDDAYFDGNEWKESHAVTTSEKVAKWKSGTDRKPTPLYALPAAPSAPE